MTQVSICVYLTGKSAPYYPELPHRPVIAPPACCVVPGLNTVLLLPFLSNQRCDFCSLLLPGADFPFHHGSYLCRDDLIHSTQLCRHCLLVKLSSFGFTILFL